MAGSSRESSSETRSGSATASQSDVRAKPCELDVPPTTADTSASTLAPRTPGTAKSLASSKELDTDVLPEVDEFQLYQKFRLHMVRLFGSLASALYELGAEPETGNIPRSVFVDVLQKLNLFTSYEASQVFDHATNTVSLDGGIDGNISFRDFLISEDDWRLVTERKKRAAEGFQAMPFESGPSGSSLGSFLRAFTLQDALDQEAAKVSTLPDLDENEGAICSASPNRTSSKNVVTPSNNKIQRTQTLRQVKNSRSPKKSLKSWQQPQVPWTPSTLRGCAGDFSFEKFVADARPLIQNPTKNRKPFARDPSLSEATMSQLRQPSLSTLGDLSRTLPDSTQFAASTPVSRKEMEPKTCPRQRDAWWPYPSMCPRLRARRLFPLEASSRDPPNDVVNAERPSTHRATGSRTDASERPATVGPASLSARESSRPASAVTTDAWWPYMSLSPSQRSGVEVKPLPSPRRRFETPRPILPSTLSFLCFRNADRAHTGTAIFLPRRPATMQEVVAACALQCAPLIGPAVGLFDLNKEAMQSVDCLAAGGIYVLKGQEGSWQPPHAAFAVDAPKTERFRHVNATAVTAYQRCGQFTARLPRPPGMFNSDVCITEGNGLDAVEKTEDSEASHIRQHSVAAASPHGDDHLIRS
eukprot:TRINITY_DN1567_c0_g2_i1.p1 TRINITY_DN1567_c0_g2~~TRINITY_DN1567_c0_g2_i1.p1  ORF type:complete len:643 (+),score=62.86 TRINITY_DN1567_c0_g2_i1:48-1976(+)